MERECPVGSKSLKILLHTMLTSYCNYEQHVHETVVGNDAALL
jgi:hypothetical protein